MFKLFGAMMIIVSFGITGLSKSLELKLRYESLCSLIDSFVLISREISYGKTEAHVLLSSIGKTRNIPILCRIAQAMKKNNSDTAYYDILSEKKLFLLENDKRILIDFFESFGTMDTNSQLSSISHTQKLLELAKNEAFAKKQKFGKLYGESGFLLGTLFAILLL